MPKHRDPVFVDAGELCADVSIFGHLLPPAAAEVLADEIKRCAAEARKINADMAVLNNVADALSAQKKG